MRDNIDDKGTKNNQSLHLKRVRGGWIVYGSSGGGTTNEEIAKSTGEVVEIVKRWLGTKPK